MYQNNSATAANSASALRTAAPYLKATGQKATVWPLLYECCTGRPSGKSATKFGWGGKITLPKDIAGLFRLDWTPEGGRPAGWEGFTDLVEFNHDDPRAVDLVVEVMEHWLARGISGWRLDVAYAVPLAFWREVTDRVRAAYPSAVFVGEVIHGGYHAFVSEGGLDSVTEYELWKAIWSSLKDENLWELAHAFERHAAFCAEFLPQTFVGNHDVTRVASKLTELELRAVAAYVAGLK